MSIAVHPNVLLPALTSLLGFAFIGVLLKQCLQRPRAYLGVWLVGLLWYTLAAATEALGGTFGWTVALYQIWYITGAIGVAAYLGAGTVYLHRSEAGFRSLTVVCLLLSSAPALATSHLTIGFIALGAAALITIALSVRPAAFADAVMIVLVVTSLAAAVAVLSAPVNTALLPASADEVVSGQAFGPETRAVTPPLNLSGAVLLLVGAATSAIHFWRTRAQPNRVASNVLIAAGAFVPSIASGLTRFGVTSLFFVGELLGLACILAGFLLSASGTPPPVRDPAAKPSAPATVSR